MAEENYSKLVAWEIFNFMSIEYAKLTFDETNIVNIKGYNDSGKSAALRALDVLFFNVKPASQVRFIKDGCDYFRVLCHFSDGVMILRDKYINGQGLYEMYKDGKLIFTTKSGNELTRINDVPEVVKQYLGLITSDAWNVNSRSCFEQQLLVQTKGSENSKALNEILRSEEIAQAGELLNTDKNKLNSRISAISAELEVYKRQTQESNGVSGEMVSALRHHDGALIAAEERARSIESAKTLVSEINEIRIFPKMDAINTSQLKSLEGIKGVLTELKSIPSIPEVPLMDTSALVLLGQIKKAYTQLSELPEIPETSGIDVSKIHFLMKIYSAMEDIKQTEKQIKDCEYAISEHQKRSEKLSAELEKIGHKFVKCQNCGTMVAVTE